MICIALGSNRSGKWGSPETCIETALSEIGSSPLIRICAASSLYSTSGIGPWRPENFINAVVVVETYLSPSALISFLKRLEKKAGSRSSIKWGPRSLDLDIIDYRGRVCGWDFKRRAPDMERAANGIVLPHAFAHSRSFVLEPLSEVAPNWRHPVFHLTASQCQSKFAPLREGRVLTRLL